MNPGVGEEVGKTARSFMDSMKEQPLALALCVMNFALLAVLFYVAKTTSETRHHEFEANMNQQKEINQLLSKCIVPADKT